VQQKREAPNERHEGEDPGGIDFPPLWELKRERKRRAYSHPCVWREEQGEIQDTEVERTFLTVHSMGSLMTFKIQEFSSPDRIIIVLKDLATRGTRESQYGSVVLV